MVVKFISFMFFILMFIAINMICDILSALYRRKCFRCKGRMKYIHKEYNVSKHENEYCFICPDCGCVEYVLESELFSREREEDMYE